MERINFKRVFKEQKEMSNQLETLQEYNDLKQILENYEGTMEDFFNEYSGEEINENYMTLYYGKLKVKIYKDLSLDGNFIEYDSQENATPVEYEEV